MEKLDSFGRELRLVMRKIVGDERERRAEKGLASIAKVLDTRLNRALLTASLIEIEVGIGIGSFKGIGQLISSGMEYANINSIALQEAVSILNNNIVLAGSAAIAVAGFSVAYYKSVGKLLEKLKRLDA